MMSATWKDFLLEHNKDWGFPSGEWRHLVHNNYHPHYSGINLLWFSGNQPFPAIITKLHAERGILEREFNNLRQVEACQPGCTPRPLHFGPIGDHWSLWMAGVPGYGFALQDNCSMATLEPIAETVIALHRYTRTLKSPADDGRHRRMVLEPLQTVADFGKSTVVQDGCKRLAEKISADWVNALPVIPQHGDLYVGNLLSDRNQWHIVDWESFGSIDLPLYDLLTLCLSILRAGGNAAGQWRSSMVGDASPLIKRYCDAFDLSREDSRMLLPLTLANWFHLQWADGRQEFCQALYKSIGDYFECQDLWERILTLRG